jgi:hypothetical protein
MLRICLVSVLFASISACGGGGGGADNDPFDTYQDCWNEHHTVENFSVQRAIEICCIDHPIGDADMNTVCGDTTASCVTYVTANLDPSDATSDDINAACTDYPADSGRTGD